MRNEDLKQLGARLGQLAEAFDRKPPTPGAMLVWLDVLKEFPLHDVESMLVDMPKRLTKFPAPAEVWKACNERRADHIENQERLRVVESVPRPTNYHPKSPTGRLEIAKIKAILAKPRPAKSAWIGKVRDREMAGDPDLKPYTIALARDAAHRLRIPYDVPVDIAL